MSLLIWKSRKILGSVSFTKGMQFWDLPLTRLVAYDDVGQVWHVHDFDAIIGPGLDSPALIHE